MEWHQHFEKVFFDSWQKKNLPNHQEYVHEYIALREHGDFKSDWIKNAPNISTNINGSQLHSVYGFGVAIGKILAEMIGTKEKMAEDTADWCGRFNLGVSLFDYICDEMDGQNNVASLKVFQPFLSTTEPAVKLLSPAEELLSRIAGGVLNDVSILNEKNNESQAPDILFEVMKEMFDAQNFLSKERLSAQADLNKIKKALYCKSAEPFRMMAEYTARSTDRNDLLLIENARSLGKAIGYCYWIIDDAKDVWIDLKAGQWNLFLQMAASEDPLIFSKKSEASTNDHLQSIWKQSKHAEKLSGQIVESLVRSTEVLDATEEVKKHSLGLIAASLWQWHSY